MTAIKNCNLLSLFVHDIALSVLLLQESALRVSVNVSGGVAISDAVNYLQVGNLDLKEMFISVNILLHSAGGVG